MKTIAGVLIVAALACGSGCAQKDWIDRTLVTVDVTGTWYGSVGGVPGYGASRDLVFDLAQQGSTVKGSMRLAAGGSSFTSASGSRINAGSVEGAVAGDVFRFRLTNSSLEGELTVNGDEMNGRVSLSGSQPISLRRADSSNRPVSPPR